MSRFRSKKERDSTPTWDSVLSAAICGVIAIIVICIAVNWLQKPAYVENIISEYDRYIVESGTDVSVTDVKSNSDSSESTEITSNTTTESETVTTTVIEAVEKKYLVVIVKTAVIRESNTVKSDKIANISKGKKLEMLEKKGKWYKIEYMGKIGWIHTNCVEECE